MGDMKPNTTEKIKLPKNLQREMIKFFAQAQRKIKAKQEKDEQQTPEIPKKGVLKIDKHWCVRSGFHQRTGEGRLLYKGARGKIAKLRQNKRLAYLQHIC